MGALELRHPGGTTEIRVGPGLLGDPPEPVVRRLAGRTVFLLSTPRVRELWGEAPGPLVAGARRVVELSAEDGEGAKSLATAGRLWEEMIAAGGKRDSRLVAFGGGSLNDLGGFVAGCFLRGIEVVQVPTTLLAQVDAAIGGKTAIDLPGAKNSVGLFHHPGAVLADVSLLETLPPGELRSGLVEAIKMASLLDLDLLERIEADLGAILAADPEVLAPVVEGAARAKVRVVEADPGEAGWRRVLNFGHTLGHAIETALGYRELRHGEAVAYGMLFAARLAVARGGDRELAERLRRLLGRLELPELPVLDPPALLSLMGRDKKASEKGLVWVLPAGPGRPELTRDVDPGLVARELAGFLRDPWG